jgi:RimJ/RimL family protein N-acetyltransferase
MSRSAAAISARRFVADLAALVIDLEVGEVRLKRFADRHVEPLRAACAEDPDIWEIMPRSLYGEHFDAEIASRRLGTGVLYAVCQSDEVVGTTAFLRPDAAEGVLELGGTYIAPSVRGTGFNGRMKKLMIDHAFACGFRRIEFRIDERNQRSQAAVAKLGARREGLLRQDRVTWTGHLRNTCVFGLLREDWTGDRIP